MLIDIHTHTSRYSNCGRSEPTDMLASAIERGLDAIVFTEHHVIWPPDELAELRRSYPAIRILAGTEITCETGDDLLIYGLDSIDGFYRKMPAQELLDLAHRHGAAVVLAHPYRFFDTVPDAVVPGSLAGVEVMSKNIHMYAHQRAVALAKDLGAHMTAASDGHHDDQLGLYALEFADTINDMADLVAALHGGRFAPRIDRDRVNARNAWLDGLIAEVDDMMAKGQSDRDIRIRFPELTLTLLSHYREGMDVHWPDVSPARHAQPTL